MTISNPKPGEIVPVEAPEGLHPFAKFFAQELQRHQRDAHAFVDSLFNNEGIDGSNNAWRRLLSAMMEDHRLWQARDKTKKFSPAMSIPLRHMEDLTEETK